MKTALIVGASSGIGLRIASGLTKLGYSVANISRAECNINGVENFVADVSDSVAYGKALERAVNHFPQIDLAVYSAGYTMSGSVEEIPEKNARYLLDVNFFGAASMAKTVIPAMRKRLSGKIILISSIAQTTGLPFEAYYCASKAALGAFSKNLSIELAPFGVQVCCIMPGGTATPFTSSREIIETENSPYHDNLRAAVKTINSLESDGANAVKVADTIVNIAERKTMPLTATIGLSNILTDSALKLLPDRASSWIISKVFGQHKLTNKELETDSLLDCPMDDIEEMLADSECDCDCGCKKTLKTSKSGSKKIPKTSKSSPQTSKPSAKKDSASAGNIKKAKTGQSGQKLKSKPVPAVSSPSKKTQSTVGDLTSF